MKFPTLRAATMAVLLPLALAAQLAAQPVLAQTSSEKSSLALFRRKRLLHRQPIRRLRKTRLHKPLTRSAGNRSGKPWRLVHSVRQARGFFRRTMRDDAERHADDRPEVGLSVVVLKTVDRKARILRILAPLGVLLKDGMDLFVDGNKIGRAYFTRCLPKAAMWKWRSMTNC